jgi:hypothetical protein
VVAPIRGTRTEYTEFSVVSERGVVIVSEQSIVSARSVALMSKRGVVIVSEQSVVSARSVALMSKHVVVIVSE